ncbi:hypothetical protein DB30_01222 [Enhygromyxa salina]|uniref:Lipoprotein n=1 Tax=Enhygromyxa salina TaxID=215803 RepID=A0A0C1ZNE1_9BACT|nr:hypothetical protein [Enhygromyxa salina]KIG12598.1 hypothetical protein DB30_01222 [Enhygromyxa salina]
MSSSTRSKRVPRLFLLLAPGLFTSACALVSTDVAVRDTHSLVPHDPAGPVIARGIVHGQNLALESRPSSHAAALLPAHAHYRVVLDGPGELALVVVNPAGAVAGRLHIHPLTHSLGGPAASIVLDEFDGPPARIEVWTTVEGLRGEAVVGGRSARWQVRLDTAGALVGETWSARQGSRGPELSQLRRARAIGADLGQLGAQLQDGGALEPTTERELLELLSFTELALELSVRAWEGRGRSHLPTLDMDP